MFCVSEKSFRTHRNHVVSLFLQSQWQWNDYGIVFGNQQKITSCFRGYLTEKYNSEGNLSKKLASFSSCSLLISFRSIIGKHQYFGERNCNYVDQSSYKKMIWVPDWNEQRFKNVIICDIDIVFCSQNTNRFRTQIIFAYRNITMVTLSFGNQVQVNFLFFGCIQKQFHTYSTAILTSIFESRF